MRAILIGQRCCIGGHIGISCQLQVGLCNRHHHTAEWHVLTRRGTHHFIQHRQRLLRLLLVQKRLCQVGHLKAEVGHHPAVVLVHVNAVLHIVHVPPSPFVHHVVVHDVRSDGAQNVGVVVLRILQRHQSVRQPFEPEVILKPEVTVWSCGDGEVYGPLPIVVGNQIQRCVVVLRHVGGRASTSIRQGPFDRIDQILGFLRTHQTRCHHGS